MRDLSEVITRMLAIIPVDELELRQALEEQKQSIDIAPPEMIFSWWNEVGDTLYNYVFSEFYPEIGWQDELERIWTGDEDPDDLEYSNF